MAKVTLTTATVTEIVPDATGEVHGIWFQNRSAGDIHIAPRTEGDPDVDSLMLPAAVAGVPSTLLIQNSGGENTVANVQWQAYQASGGDLDLHYGRV